MKVSHGCGCWEVLAAFHRCDAHWNRESGEASDGVLGTVVPLKLAEPFKDMHAVTLTGHEMAMLKDAPAVNAALNELRERTAKLLKAIEWNREREDEHAIGRACPRCAGWSAGPEMGHREGCELAALLKELG